MAYKKALAAAAGMILATAAHAQAAGSNIVSLGWFRVMPNSSSDPLLVKSIGGMPVNQSQSGTGAKIQDCLLYTSPSPRDRTRSRMPSSA